MPFFIPKIMQAGAQAMGGLANAIGQMQKPPVVPINNSSQLQSAMQANPQAFKPSVPIQAVDTTVGQLQSPFQMQTGPAVQHSMQKTLPALDQVLPYEQPLYDKPPLDMLPAGHPQRAVGMPQDQTLLAQANELSGRGGVGNTGGSGFATDLVGALSRVAPGAGPTPAPATPAAPPAPQTPPPAPVFGAGTGKGFIGDFKNFAATPDFPLVLAAAGNLLQGNPVDSGTYSWLAGMAQDRAYQNELARQKASLTGEPLGPLLPESRIIPASRETSTLALRDAVGWNNSYQDTLDAPLQRALRQAQINQANIEAQYKPLYEQSRIDVNNARRDQYETQTGTIAEQEAAQTRSYEELANERAARALQIPQTEEARRRNYDARTEATENKTVPPVSRPGSNGQQIWDGEKWVNAPTGEGVDLQAPKDMSHKERLDTEKAIEEKVDREMDTKKQLELLEGTDRTRFVNRRRERVEQEMAKVFGAPAPASTPASAPAAKKETAAGGTATDAARKALESGMWNGQPLTAEQKAALEKRVK